MAAFFRLPSRKPRQIVDGAVHVPTPVHVHMPFCGRQQRWPGSISWRAALSAESCRTYGVRCIIVPTRLPGLRQGLRSAGDAPHLPGASAMFTGVALSPVEFPGVFPHLLGLRVYPFGPEKGPSGVNPVRPFASETCIFADLGQSFANLGQSFANLGQRVRSDSCKFTTKNASRAREFIRPDVAEHRRPSGAGDDAGAGCV